MELIFENIVGINEYLLSLNVDFIFKEEEWCQFINCIAERMLS